MKPRNPPKDPERAAGGRRWAITPTSRGGARYTRDMPEIHPRYRPPRWRRDGAEIDPTYRDLGEYLGEYLGKYLGAYLGEYLAQARLDAA